MSAPGQSQSRQANDDEFRAAPLNGEDIAAFRSALNAAGLPADDILEPGVQSFRFTRGSELVGHGAMEIYGGDVLLRSIVVAAEARGEGVGRRVVAWLLAYASRLGAKRAYLLTPGARGYFESLGFAVLARAEAPRAILTTRQAAGLCPASAALMTRVLDLAGKP